MEQAVRHTKTPEAALAYGQTQVQIEREKVFNRDSHPLLPIGAVTGAVVFFALDSVWYSLHTVVRINGCAHSAAWREPKREPASPLFSPG